MLRRINKDRAGLKRGNMNIHYENMKKKYKKLCINSEELLYDDGGELLLEPKYNWVKIYF